MTLSYFLLSLLTVGFVPTAFGSECSSCNNARQKLKITNSEDDRTFATYDVEEICIDECEKHKLGYYQVSDERLMQHGIENYTYVFNIYNTIVSWPTYAELGSLQSGGDISELCTPNTSSEAPAFAYQLKWENGEIVGCFSLSNSSFEPIFDFLNVNDPSSGFKMTYTNGSMSTGCKKKQRQFHLEFSCSSTFDFSVTHKTTTRLDFELKSGSMAVFEDPDLLCDYTLQFENTYGCPAECPRTGVRVCSNFGLCGYDFSTKLPRCYCYAYMTGDACNIPDIEQQFNPPHEQSPDSSNAYTKKFEFDSINIAKFKTDLGLELPQNKVPNIHHFTNNRKDKSSVWYDLSTFVLPDNDDNDEESVYKVQDIDGLKYEYYFNILEKVDLKHLPIACQQTKNYSWACDNDTHIIDCETETVSVSEHFANSNSESEQFGYAFQYDPDQKQCWLLGTELQSWTLYDADHPAKGSIIKYDTGGYCQFHGNRQFEIRLICPDDNLRYYSVDDTKGKSSFDAYVVETDDHSCSYYLEMESALACPYQCLTDVPSTKDDKSDWGVCNNQGMCVNDPMVGYVRCLCDTGFTGDFCDKKVHYHNHDAQSYIGYIVAIVVLAVFLVACCYCSYQRLSHQHKQIKVLRTQLVNSQQTGGDASTMHDQMYASALDTPNTSGKIVNSMKSLKQKIVNKGKKTTTYENLEDDDMLATSHANPNATSDMNVVVVSGDRTQTVGHVQQAFEIGREDDEEEEDEDDDGSN